MPDLLLVDAVRRSFGVLKRMLLNFALPDSCLHCVAPLQKGEPCLCAECARSLRLTPGYRPFTPIEGEPRTEERDSGGGFVFAASYDGAVGALVRALKFGDRPDAAPVLATLLSALLDRELGETERRDALIIPVPLHRTRRRERGYDQTRLLADSLARTDGYDIDHDVLERVRATPPQTRLARIQRLSNVRHSFRVRSRPPDDRALVLLDDVVTTGATLEAARAALLGAGLHVRLAAAVAGAHAADAGGKKMEEDPKTAQNKGISKANRVDTRCARA